MTAPQTPVPAVAAASLAAGTGPIADTDAFVRMLEDDADIEQLLKALRERHSMDLGGPALSALTRALGTVEMLRLELRLIRNYLGGAS